MDGRMDGRRDGLAGGQWDGRTNLQTVFTNAFVNLAYPNPIQKELLQAESIDKVRMQAVFFLAKLSEIQL